MHDLGCQFVPVGVFVVTQNGAGQPKCHMNPHLVLHSYKKDRQTNRRSCAWKEKKRNVLLSRGGCNSHPSTAEARRGCNRSCCPELCTWWLQNVPAGGLGPWSNRHRRRSFWKEDLEPSERKTPEGYKKTIWLEHSYNNAMANYPNQFNWDLRRTTGTSTRSY